MRDPGKARIRKIDPDGAFLDARFPQADRPSRQTQLATLDAGRKLAILFAPKPIGPQRVEPARCVVVDVKTGKVVAESTPRPLVAPAAEFDAAEAHRLWRLLGSTDAAEADRALQRLRAGGEAALAALKPGLGAGAAAAEPLPAEAIAQLIKQLDNATEIVRERATSDLIQAGGPAVADALREAAKQDLPAEAQARLNLILADIATPAAAERRNARLVAVLAEIATPAAVEHLIALSGGAPDSRATLAARRALREL
jgi:hypothetical protein